MRNKFELFDDRQLGQTIKHNVTRYEATHDLRRSVVAAISRLDADSSVEEEDQRSSALIAALTRLWRRWASVGISFAVGLLASVAVTAYLQRGAAEERLRDEVYSSHIRSLMPGHTYDVASSDKHTVKPWFNGKLDFAPKVVDLAGSGYVLLGGRLEYLQQHNAAAVVYQRRQHLINVFVVKIQNNTSEPQIFTRHGINGIAWREDGLQYFAVSDLAAGELNSLVELLRSRSSQEGQKDAR